MFDTQVGTGLAHGQQPFPMHYPTTLLMPYYSHTNMQQTAQTESNTLKFGPEKRIKPRHPSPKLNRMIGRDMHNMAIELHALERDLLNITLLPAAGFLLTRAQNLSLLQQRP